MLGMGPEPSRCLSRWLRRFRGESSLLHLRLPSLSAMMTPSIALGDFSGIPALAPNLREPAMNPCYGLHLDEKDPKDRVVRENVSSIKLRSGHISKFGLESIIYRCRKLEIFEYNYHSILLVSHLYCVTPREVIDILRRHCSTLRSVSISLGSQRGGMGTSNSVGSPSRL